MPTRVKSASEVYLSLSSNEHGIALLIPTPNENLPDEYRRTGVRIGDVGIRRGENESFEPLFNALLPAKEAVNQNWGVPQGFVPFTVGAGRNVAKWKGYHAPGTIIARGMENGRSLTLGGNSVRQRSIPLNAGAGSSAELSLRCKCGAALILPKGASREDLIPKDHFYQYVQEHAAAWYAFAEALGFLPSDRRDNALFVGCDKASAWVITTASRKRGSVGCNISLSLPGVANVNLAPRYEWERDASALVRVSENMDSDEENQCVFLRGFIVPKPRSAMSLWRRLVKGRDNEHKGVRNPAVGKSHLSPADRLRRLSLPAATKDTSAVFSSPNSGRASVTRPNRPSAWGLPVISA